MIVLLVISVLGVGTYLLLLSAPVQDMIGKRVLSSLSKRTDAEISASSVRFVRFRKLEISDLYVKDKQNDTLVYAPKVVAVLDSLSRTSHMICLSSLVLDSPQVNIVQEDSDKFNYSFIVDSLSNPDKQDSRKWEVDLDRIQIKEGDIKAALYEKDPICVHRADIDVAVEKNLIYVNQLAFNMDNGFCLRRTNADIRINPKRIVIPHLSLTTDKSTLLLRNISLATSDSTLSESSLDKLQLNIQSNNSSISGVDISYFIPKEYRFDESIILDGKIQGNTSKLQGTGIHLKLNSVADLNSNFEITNLLDTSLIGFNFDLENLTFEVVGLADFYNNMLPNRVVDASEYAHWGKISYQGNVCGTSETFSTKGMIKTNYGDLKTDLFVFLYDSLQTVEYNGDVLTNSFHLGGALQDEENYGDMSAQLFVSGGKMADGQFGNYFKGDISSITLKQYEYNNIEIEGGLGHRSFNGDLRVDDENAKFDFSGKIDFWSDKPVFNYSLDLKHLALAQLNLTDKYEQLDLSLNLDSRLEGKNIDDLNGYLNITDLVVHSEHNSFVSDSINCKFRPLDEMPSITLSSEYVNGLILGSYNFKDLMGYINASMKKHLKYLPDYFDVPTNKVPNNFTYAFEVNDLQNLTKTLDFPLRSNGYSVITGAVNSEKGIFDFEGEIPYLQVKDQLLDSVSIGITNNNDQFSSKFDIREFTFGSGREVKDISVLCNIKQDKVDFKTNWENDGEKQYNGDYEAKISLEPYGKDVKLKIETQPSDIVFSDTLWHVNKNTISFLPKRIIVDNFKLENSDSYFLLDGTISHKTSDTLRFEINQFNLANLDRFLSIRNFTFRGTMSGKAEFYSLMDKSLLVSDLKVNALSLNQVELGDFSAASHWNREQEALEIKVMCESLSSGDSTVHIRGNYYPKRDDLDILGDFNGFNISFLKPYLAGTLSEVKGEAYGHLDVKGELGNPELYGGLKVDSGAFGIDYLSTIFYVNDTIKFDKHRFVFDNVPVQDQDGNYAIVNGDVSHTKYKNMLVDISVESDCFLGLNTSSMENEYFYGDVYFGGVITIKSTDTHTYIGSNVKTMKGTNLTVPLSPVSTANTNDFIRYVDRDEVVVNNNSVIRPIKIEPKEKPGKILVIDMDFNVTSDATLRLDFDAQSGDIIEAVGDGKLNIQFQKGQPFQLFGDYTITKGSYSFKFQQILTKNFDIVAGSKMRFSGRPGDAMMDITGQYSTKASLYNLMPDVIDESNRNKRIPVNVKLLLTKSLAKPDIAFDIELPNTDQETKMSVSSIINSEEEMSRQVLALLIMNNFYTPEYYANSSGDQNNNQFSSAAAVTVSEFLSSQLSNWMSGVSDKIDFGFRYTPEQELSDEGLTPDEYELMMSYQLFNDRLIVNGNASYQDYSEETRPPNVNSNFVGEVDVLWKLTKHLNLKAYSHQNDDILYENSNMKQGAGIAYQEDFSTFKELLGRYKSRIFKLFGAKDKPNKEAVKPEEPDLADE